MENGFIGRLRDFFKRPFREDMDVWNVILLTMLVVAVAIFWTRILRQITE